MPKQTIKTKKKTSKNSPGITSNLEFFKALSSVALARAELSSKLGIQYSGERDLYQALGYKTDLEYTDYWTQYDRQDIAKAIIDRPVQATWQGGVELVESDDDEETELEKSFGELYDNKSLGSIFTRLDKLTGIGCYGILLLGLSDVKNKEDYKNEVTSKNMDINYIKPLSQNSAKVSTWEENPAHERFGKPLTYDITLSSPGGTGTTTTTATSQLQVHWSRIIHVAEGLLESEVIGTPRLKAVFNRLYDMEKLVGGSAEMFWRGARGGFQILAEKEYSMGAAERADLKDQIDEYEHNLRRILNMQGVKLEALAQQISDPQNHVDIQFQMISAVTGIPKRIFTGSERGQLASSQDDKTWKELLLARREEFAEPIIVRQFVDRMILFGILPPAKDKYSVKWSDLFSQSEKEKAEVGKIIADSLALYSRDPIARNIIPPSTFLKFVIGLSEEKVKMIEEDRKNEVKLEVDDFAEGE